MEGRGGYPQVPETNCLGSSAAPLKGLESRLIIQLQRGRGQLSKQRRKSSLGKLEGITFLIRQPALNGVIPSLPRRCGLGLLKARLSLPDSFLRNYAFAFLLSGPDTAHALHSSRKVPCKCTCKEKSSRKSEVSSDSVLYHQSGCCLSESG